MKRLFSRLLLLLCSLTFCSAAGAQQTWRLTDTGTSDMLPKTAIDNSGQVWVIWLSNESGNYDLYCSRYSGTVWGTAFGIQNDNVDQHCCAITNDSTANRMWVAWDSSGLIATKYKEGTTWHDPMISDSVNPYKTGTDLLLASDDSGKLYLSWTTDSNAAASDGMMQTFSNNTWNEIHKIFPGYDGGMLGGMEARSVDITSNVHTSPVVLGYNNGGSMGGFSFANVMYSCWNVDSSMWLTYPIDYWTGNLGNFNQSPTAIAIQRKDDQLLAIYCANTPSDSNALKCDLYNLSSFTFDTTHIIKTNCHIQSGAMAGCIRPTLAWSDSHSVFLNTYYDTIWSHPPVRISDSSLYNCINPDIVAENDSTVWVCYQNDGDIYVTRTSVPLGVTGMQNSELRIAKPLALKAWPNPASNVIHFSYTLPNTHNSSVAIYDIIGRLVKNLEVKDNQINWNCADNAGRKVASGVYFARLTSDGQETIRKISVIR